MDHVEPGEPEAVSETAAGAIPEPGASAPGPQQGPFVSPTGPEPPQAHGPVQQPGATPPALFGIPVAPGPLAPAPAYTAPGYVAPGYAAPPWGHPYQPAYYQPQPYAHAQSWPQPPQPPQYSATATATATASEPADRKPISPRRAALELAAVYVPAFGLGIVNAIGLLVYPSLGNIPQISPWFNASSDIFSYTMQAMVVIFGVAFFSMRRGLTLSALFGRPVRPTPPPMVAPGWVPGYPGPGYGGYPGAGLRQPRPEQRGVGWQFSRAYFLSLLGVFMFLVAVLLYDHFSNHVSGAPSQGGGFWLIPDGIVTALAAGFGEEVLITGMLVTTLEQAGFGKRPWVIYLAAVCLRIPFHLYYGWAAFAVITFTLTNIWVYRRWRLLWPIVLAHATYDALQFLGQLNAGLGGLSLVLLFVATVIMAIVIASIEISDAVARRSAERARLAALSAPPGWPVAAPAPPPRH